MQIDALIKELNAAGIRFLVSEPMSRHTSFQIGGPADLFAEVSEKETAVRICSLCREYDVPVTVMGKGSNLLVSDEGISGLVLAFSAASDAMERIGENSIFAPAGVPLISVCRYAAAQSLSGLEFAYGIPASVGGALYMNAGAYGGSVSDVAESAECLMPDGRIRVFSASEMEFGYRESVFKTSSAVILSACFRLVPGEKAEISARMEELMSRRREKQPLEYPSAGSVFKRPEGHFAGALIDECGLKGKRIGGAEVSLKHGGFIVNRGRASCSDVRALIELIQTTVLAKKGIALEPEIRMIGK